MGNDEHTIPRRPIDGRIIEDFALENLELHARIDDLASERDSYRELAQQGIHALHDLVGERGSSDTADHSGSDLDVRQPPQKLRHPRPGHHGTRKLLRQSRMRAARRATAGID